MDGHEFTLITEHASLKRLMFQISDLSTCLFEWVLKLQNYKFKITHRRGSQNTVPNALSQEEYKQLVENVSKSLDKMRGAKHATEELLNDDLS